jgi:hypothetical protein
MSFGGHVAKAAAAVVAVEAEADEALENSLAGISISDDDNLSDMSLDRAQQAEELVSIASSANAMALEEARAEVAKLRTEKYLAEKALEQERCHKRKAKGKVASPNKILHDKIVNETADIIDTIKEMDNCSPWWVNQWVNECLAELATTDMQKSKSYKDFVIRNTSTMATPWRRALGPCRRTRKRRALSWAMPWCLERNALLLLV